MKKIITLILLLTIVTGCGCSKKDDIETPTKLQEEHISVADKKVGSLDIIDFIVVYEDNVSTVYFDVENNSDEVVNYKNLNFKLYENSENQVLASSVELGEMNPGDVKQVKVSFDSNLTRVNNAEYELTNE